MGKSDFFHLIDHSTALPHHLRRLKIEIAQSECEALLARFHHDAVKSDSTSFALSHSLLLCSFEALLNGLLLNLQGAPYWLNAQTPFGPFETYR